MTRHYVSTDGESGIVSTSQMAKGVVFVEYLAQMMERSRVSSAGGLT